MARVHLLEDELINKIAAGEVVERPASVVKELVENAIDAGANRIKVSLKDGGRQLISVQDNGCGMAASDARLSLKRHSTSKLQSLDDLFAMKTMGFRGEALASIAAVSRLTLQTQAEGECGLRIRGHDGQWQEDLWSGPRGTTMTVEELFFNVPARKAFLKTASAEFAACYDYLLALALSLPELSFSLLHNEKEIFSVEALPVEQDKKGEFALRSRRKALGKPEASDEMIYLWHQDRICRIEALVSPPGYEKATQKQIFTFVNQRWVKDKLLRFSIQRAYHSHLLKGRYPEVYLYLTLNPELVDVNVHPAKTELRFQYAQDVGASIALAVREALRQGNWAKPPQEREQSRQQAATYPSPSPAEPMQDLSVPSRKPENPANFDLVLPQTATSEDRRKEGTEAPWSNSRPSWGVSPAGPSARANPSATQPIKRTVQRFEADVTPLFANAETPAQASQPNEAIPWAELRLIGSFAQCFLLFEHQEQFLLIDQHAFHERIIYERLMNDPDVFRQSQQLLIPEVVDLPALDCERLEELRPSLQALGIQLEKVSETEVEVQAVPPLLVQKDLRALLASFLRGHSEKQEVAHDIFASMACHAAVRAGEDIPPQELKTLLLEAEAIDFYHNCPHGRRVFRWFKLSQVASWFDR